MLVETAFVDHLDTPRLGALAVRLEGCSLGARFAQSDIRVRSEAVLEAVRDAVDEIGVDYQHVDSEPNEDAYPQTAYFQIQSGLTEDAESVLEKLSEEHGFDAEIL